MICATIKNTRVSTSELIFFSQLKEIRKLHMGYVIVYQIKHNVEFHVRKRGQPLMK